MQVGRGSGKKRGSCRCRVRRGPCRLPAAGWLASFAGNAENKLAVGRRRWCLFRQLADRLATHGEPAMQRCCQDTQHVRGLAMVTCCSWGSYVLKWQVAGCVKKDHGSWLDAEEHGLGRREIGGSRVRMWAWRAIGGMRPAGCTAGASDGLSGGLVCPCCREKVQLDDGQEEGAAVWWAGETKKEKAKQTKQKKKESIKEAKKRR